MDFFGKIINYVLEKKTYVLFQQNLVILEKEFYEIVLTLVKCFVYN